MKIVKVEELIEKLEKHKGKNVVIVAGENDFTVGKIKSFDDAVEITLKNIHLRTGGYYGKKRN